MENSIRLEGSARLFLGMPLPGALRKKVARFQEDCRWNAKAVRVPANKLHVTLYFIGEVERKRIHEIIQAVEVKFAPFLLQLAAPERWGHGLVLMPVLAPSAELARIRGVMESRLEGLGLNRDTKAFKPHVTLARNAARVVWPSSPAPDDVWQVREYQLLESRQPGAGPYRVVHRYSASDNGGENSLPHNTEH
jgi:2'-5' RNA ligase